MIRSRLLVSVLLSMAAPVSLFAQKDQSTFNHLTTADGLANSNVMCTFRDSRGFVWFGTESGLSRYDGYHMTTYKNIPSDSHSLSHNFVKDIIETSDGDLWVATMGGGLDHYDRKKDEFTTYRNKTGTKNCLSNDFISDLMLDHTGKIWICTSEGLNLFDPATHHFTWFHHDSMNKGSISEDQPTYALEDSRKNIWVATSASGLEKFDTTTKTFHHFRHLTGDRQSLSGDHLWTLFEDSRGQLWVGTAGAGLNKMDPFTGKCTVYRSNKKNQNSLCNDVIFSITEDDDQNLWIGSENGGVSKYDLRSGTFHTYISNELDNTTLNTNAINTVYKDPKGNIWIATYNAGVNYLTKNSRTFTHYRRTSSPYSLSNNHVLAIMEDRDRNVWVGTDGGGLNMLNKKTNRFEHYTHQDGNANSIGGDHVLALLQDRDGNIWMGTWGNGVTMINKRKNIFRHYVHNPADTNSLSGNNVWVVFQDQDNNIWLGAQEQGLDRLDQRTGKFTHYKAGRDGLSSNSFISMMQEKNGTIWVGASGSGLNRYDKKTDRFIPQKYADYLIDNSPNSMFEDSRGRLWVATNSGLDLLNRKTNMFSSIHVENGLPGNVVHGILEDDRGNLWVSTNSGISKFNTEKNTFRNYDVSDGLQSNEFKQGFCKTADGVMYFGGDNGFNEFFPDSISDSHTDPSLVLTDFQVFNKSIPIAKGIDDPSPLKMNITEAKDLVLSYDNSVISFEFASLEYYSVQKKQYLYRMIGFDKVWNEIGTQHTATYTNLDPGKYVFEVKTLTSAGTWSSKIISINVTILPPYYMTWWFRILVSVTVVTILVGFFRRRMAYINRQRQLLEIQVLERTAQLELSSLQEKKARVEAEKARNDAEQANKAKSIFLATMSHEIRTPMNGVIGMASLLHKTPLNEEQKTYAETISSCGDALLTVINDILDFSKIESGHLELESRAFDLRTCVEEVLDIFAARAADTDLELIFEIDSRVPAQIMGDQMRLRQVLINLVGNAMKFTHHGEVLVQVQIAAQHADNQLELKFNIVDTGIGIPPHKLDSLFKAFAQVDSSTTRKYGGTGLGLVICDKLVTLMKGSMQVKSTEGKGSTFSFTILAAQVMTATMGNLPRDTMTTAGKRILIVDDNKTNLLILQQQLSDWKIDTLSAVNGKEALEIYKLDGQIDLVVTDMYMPEMDGIELATAIRKINADIPIILLSSVSVQNTDEKADLFYCTLSKPVKQQLLLKHLQAALSRSVTLKVLPEPAVASSDRLASRLPQRILVAEDNPINQLLIGKMLNTLGYEPVIVENGREAVNKLQEERFDIVFMDVQMPEMDGFEASIAIRKALHRQPVIIAVTANAMQGDEGLCREAGMDDYITKPLKIEVLEAAIVRWATRQGEQSKIA